MMMMMRLLSSKDENKKNDAIGVVDNVNAAEGEKITTEHVSKTRRWFSGRKKMIIASTGRSSSSPSFTRVFGIFSIIAIAGSTDRTHFFFEAEAVNPIPSNLTYTEFKQLVTACLAESGAAAVTGDCPIWGGTTASPANGYGSIPNWNTSLVTAMNQAFMDRTSFNGNILSWNTSSVTAMSAMFKNAIAFNQPIGNWTTSSVTVMTNMFMGADVFDQDIFTWTGDAATTEQSGMFQGAGAFQAKYGSFCTNNVTGPPNTCKVPPPPSPPPLPPPSPPSSSSRSPHYTKAVALVGFLSTIAPMSWF